MKQLCILILVLVGWPAWADYAPDDVVIDGQRVLDKKGQPVTGHIIQKFENKKPLLDISVEKGDITETTVYYPSGALKSQDNLTVRTVYRPNGAKEYEIFRSAEKPVLEKRYYANGQVAQEIPYKDRQVSGTVKIYNEDGSLLEERPYTALQTIQRDSDGNVRGLSESVLKGRARIYTPDQNVVIEEYEYGVLKKIGYQTADGKELKILKKAATDMGQVQNNLNVACQTSEAEKFTGLSIFTENQAVLQVVCKDGMADGFVRIYEGMPRLRLVQHIPVSKGKKNGLLRAYAYRDLWVSGEIPFKEDKAEGVVRDYAPTGELISETPYQNDIRQGTRRIYAGLSEGVMAGNVIGEIPYENDKANGTARVLDLNGNVIEQIEYKDGAEISRKKVTSK